MACCLICSIPFSSWADTASNSNANRDELEYDLDSLPVASGSNAVVDNFMSKNLYMFRSSLASVTNTVNRLHVGMVLSYYDMSGVLHQVKYYCDSKGNVTITRPDNFASGRWVSFFIEDSAMPPSGKYNYQLDFMSHTGVSWSYDFYGEVYRTLKNSMDVLEYGMGRDGQNNMLLPVFECCPE